MKHNEAFTLIDLCGASFAGCTRSDGIRVGIISKFSNKGLMVKSHEGELVLGGQVGTSHGGSVANIWEFTCLNPEIVPVLESAMNSNLVVSIKYHQTALYNPFRRDTTYLVENVTIVPTK